MVPQVPQLAASTLTSVHTPLQLSWGGGHWHCALRQVIPAGQTTPQSPQLTGSTLGSTHAVPHWIWPERQSPSELLSLTGSAEHAPAPSTDERRIQRNARTNRKSANFISNLQIALRVAQSVELHPAQHANLRLLQNTALMLPDSSATATALGPLPRVDPLGMGGSLEPIPYTPRDGSRPLPCGPGCGNDGSAFAQNPACAAAPLQSSQTRADDWGCGKLHWQGEEWQPGRNTELLYNSSLPALPKALVLFADTPVRCVDHAAPTATDPSKTRRRWSGVPPPLDPRFAIYVLRCALRGVCRACKLQLRLAYADERRYHRWQI
jgi:hypothetical protein